MDALVEQDYQGAYSCLDLEERSPFLSEAVYQNLMMKSLTWRPEIQNYRIQERPEEGYDEEDFFTKIVDVEITRKGEDTSEPSLSNLEVKRPFFFGDWKILYRSVAQDVEIVSVPGASVRLDQIELSEENAEVRSDGTYIIPEMFKGPHTVEVSLPGFVPYSETIDVYGEDCSVELPLPHLTEETLKSLSEQAGQDWSALIAAVVNETTAEPFPEWKIEDEYDYLCPSSGNHVTSVDMGSIEVELEDVDLESGHIFVGLKAKSDLVVEGGFRVETVVDGDPAIAIYAAQTVIGPWELSATYRLDNGAWTHNYCNMTAADSPIVDTYVNYFDYGMERIIKKTNQSGRNDPQSTE